MAASTNQSSMSDDSKHVPRQVGLMERAEKAQGDVEDDETSSSGSSSFSDDDIEEKETSQQADENDEERLETRDAEGLSLRPTQKFSTRPTAEQASNLRSRLEAFLPKLEKANAELDDADDISERRIDHVPDDDEHYIEMNLELGVLSERKDHGKEGQLKFRESSSEDDDEDIDVSTDNGAAEEDSEQGVISQLKGEKSQHRQKRRIEVLGTDAGTANGDRDLDLKSAQK
jgi:hypothetical protein